MGVHVKIYPAASVKLFTTIMEADRRGSRVKRNIITGNLELQNPDGNTVVFDRRLKTNDGFVSGVIMTPIGCEVEMKAVGGMIPVLTENFHNIIGHANYATT